jgi:hypothetical protein
MMKAKGKSKKEKVEYLGVSEDLHGEMLIWVNRPLPDGSMTSGIYDEGTDLLCQEDWEQIEMEIINQGV